MFSILARSTATSRDGCRPKPHDGETQRRSSPTTRAVPAWAASFRKPSRKLGRSRWAPPAGRVRRYAANSRFIRSSQSAGNRRLPIHISDMAINVDGGAMTY
jgi:hypothetical protein